MNSPSLIESPRKTQVPWRGVFALIAFLSITYTMTNAGGFHIIDEVSRFAVTESLALRGNLDTNAIAWTQWVNSPREAQGDFGPQGEVYSKKGPAQPFLTTLWYLLLLLPTRSFQTSFFPEQLASYFGMLQWTMLFTGWVTAITAGLLWRTAVQLGYSERVGALLGLFFGLATIAWPYATYLLAEPLSALSLLTCFYGLLRWRNILREHRDNPTDKTTGSRWLWVAGIAAGVAVATTIVHILLVIIFCFYWLAVAIEALSYKNHGPHAADEAAPRGDGDNRPFSSRSNTLGTQVMALVRWGIPIFIPMVITVGLMVAYNIVRFDLFWNTGYQIFDGEFFITPLWEGIWGLLISPYRSFFLHSPIFILSLFAFPRFYRHHRFEALTLLGISIAIVILYGKWWMWWGGYAWGPRFLVPLAPFWILLLAPLLEHWFPNGATATGLPDGSNNHRIGSNRVAAISVIAVAIISIIVQLSAVVVNFVNFETELRGIFPTDWLEPLKFGPPATSLADFFYSPVFGQWRLLFSNPVVNSDVAWLRDDGEVLWLLLAVGGISILLSGAYLGAWWKGSAQNPTQRRQGWFSHGMPVWLSITIALAVMVFWTQQVSGDPRYGTQGEGYRAILHKIAQEGDERDAVITVAPYHYTVPMNWFQSDLPIYGYAVDSMQYAESQSLLTSVIEQHPRIWFITAGLPPADINNSVERWLSQVSYKADDQWYNDYRLVRFATAANAQQNQETVTDLVLSDGDNEVSILRVDAPTEAEAGQMIAVEITFQLEGAGQQNLRWFVQLLNSTGEAIAMTDSASQGGYRNFVDLPTEQPLQEKIGLQLPDDISAGEYRLIAGLYNPKRDGERLVTTSGDNYVNLGKITIPPDERTD